MPTTHGLCLLVVWVVYRGGGVLPPPRARPGHREQAAAATAGRAVATTARITIIVGVTVS